MKEFELQLRLRNNLIKSRRVALAMSVKQLAAAAALRYETVIGYETLRFGPISQKTGKWKPSATALARFFRVTEADLFPDAILAVRNPTASRELAAAEALALAQFAAAPEPAELPDAHVERTELRKTIERALGVLDKREKKAIVATFLEDKTLEEAGVELDVSRERARQIQASAMRKLRRRTLIGQKADLDALRARDALKEF